MQAASAQVAALQRQGMDHRRGVYMKLSRAPEGRVLRRFIALSGVGGHMNPAGSCLQRSIREVSLGSEQPGVRANQELRTWVKKGRWGAHRAGIRLGPVKILDLVVRGAKVVGHELGRAVSL